MLLEVISYCEPVGVSGALVMCYSKLCATLTRYMLQFCVGLPYPDVDFVIRDSMDNGKIHPFADGTMAIL